MKKILILSVIILGLIALFAAWILGWNKHTNTTNQSSVSTKIHTLSEIESHNSQTSCWSVINNKVYDLTAWIDEHPGGSSQILSICGTDGSSAFNEQHGGQREPADELAPFYIGEFSTK